MFRVVYRARGCEKLSENVQESREAVLAERDEARGLGWPQAYAISYEVLDDDECPECHTCPPHSCKMSCDTRTHK